MYKRQGPEVAALLRVVGGDGHVRSHEFGNDGPPGFDEGIAIGDMKEGVRDVYKRQ